jgi:hypothetical protein
MPAVTLCMQQCNCMDVQLQSLNSEGFLPGDLLQLPCRLAAFLGNGFCTPSHGSMHNT